MGNAIFVLTLRNVPANKTVCVYKINKMPLISLLVFFKYSDILRLYHPPVMDYGNFRQTPYAEQ